MQGAVCDQEYHQVKTKNAFVQSDCLSSKRMMSACRLYFVKIDTYTLFIVLYA